MTLLLMTFWMNVYQEADLSFWPMPFTRRLIHHLGVHNCLHSVACSHTATACRSEIGVKTIQKLINGSVGKDGSFENPCIPGGNPPLPF